MNIVSRLNRCPKPFDPARGDDALQHLPDLPPDVAALIRGTAGCSPYLAGLIAQEAPWLRSALDDPEKAVAQLLADVAHIDLDQLTTELRRAKRRIALIAAVCDLGGVWSLEQVTQVLTDLADAAVQACLTRLVAAEVARGKLPGGDDPARAGGMVALAMGKMGAGELNYSSDIDLICLFDETRFDPDDYHDVRAAFIRVTRRMTAILSEVKDGGYVFRTDLRLRPDASVTPVCLSMEAAERYYESVGRTWERAAYIKARPCAGDIVAGQRFLDTLRPFVWRKHLDFAAIQDAHDMRLKIRNHRGLHGPLVLEGHNMKLGRGGIREIEFFTQTRQLIAGGRDPSLRVRTTCDGLARLAKADWVPQHTADTLYDHYRFHRTVEHRLQMINDAQTHELPADMAGFDRLAAFMGTDTASLRRDLTDRLEQVNDLIEGFFAPEPAAPVGTDWGADVTSRWPTYPALRSTRGSEIFKRLAPEIIARLQEAAKPDEALAQFDRFLAGLPAGVQLFSLFEANPQLTQLIVDIAATAPALAQYLSRNAGVFDAVIGGAFFADWPGAADLAVQLGAVLVAVGDYEAQLMAARRWAKEWHFRIGVHHLRGLIDAETSGTQYADLAQAVVAGLWPVIAAEFARKHGQMPGKGAIVVGMGSLGAARLNAASDLDLIVIYDADGVETSDGRRPLATRAYYVRLTQALVTALSAPMAEGRLYEVDMRLRPSGRQGPVATSLSAFQDYQMTQAWTWEHLAMTRARVVAGPDPLADRFEAFRQTLLGQKGKGADVLADLAEMRARIADAKAPQGAWDAKIGPGRLQDIELCAQAAALGAGTAARDVAGQLAAGVADGWLDAADALALSDAAGLFWRLQAAARLLTGGAVDPDAFGEGGRRFLLRETGFEAMDDVLTAMGRLAAAADQVISRKLGAR
ncbi:glutamine-synthetase adenylyltransferase [Yoonia sp.]|uniref:[protein-PII] uridylyltransferase family protein n=1 Tax=Yoonia sp. TaxID=2212373 RepID=UPI001A0988AC|nr:glutamine-synthetase adenylyltransferase [Yoonia sp.]MBE0412824.1 glutamine-synthetase adenylyltransferase [Yoonia sp.]